VAAYLMFVKNGFRQNAVYRANTVLYAITSMLYLLIQFSIWQALYGVQAAVEQVSLSQMMTYCVINQLVKSFTDDNIVTFHFNSSCHWKSLSFSGRFFGVIVLF